MRVWFRPSGRVRFRPPTPFRVTSRMIECTRKGLEKFHSRSPPKASKAEVQDEEGQSETILRAQVRRGTKGMATTEIRSWVGRRSDKGADVHFCYYVRRREQDWTGRANFATRGCDGQPSVRPTAEVIPHNGTRLQNEVVELFGIQHVGTHRARFFLQSSGQVKRVTWNLLNLFIQEVLEEADWLQRCKFNQTVV